MRGRIKSKTAILAMSRLYAQCPHIFIPSTDLQEGEVKDMLMKVGLSMSSTDTARFWIINALKLHRFWNADPRELFKEDPSYELLCDRIKGTGKRREDNQNGFFGFQKKMVSMLAYFYMDAGIIPEKPFPLPIDFHLSRLLVTHGVLKVEGRGVGDDFLSPSLLDSGRQVTHEWCRANTERSIDLGNALWLLSSELCNKHPGNRSKKNPDAPEDRGRATQLVPVQYYWTKRLQNTFDRTCRQCPVQDTCQYQIPAAHYYVQSKLFVRDRLQQPQQLAWRFD